MDDAEIIKRWLQTPVTTDWPIGSAGHVLTFAHSLIAATREQTLQEAIDLVRRYLVYDTQRAVSWHEIQDTLEALGRIRALTRPPGDEG